LLFGLLHNYNRKLIWANLRFLFTIVLMPFTSAFYSEFWNTGFITPIAFYSINILLSGWAIYHLWALITNPANKLCGTLPPAPLITYYKVRSWVAGGVFMLSFAVSYLSVAAACIIPAGIPLVLWAIKLYFRKKAPNIFYKGSDY